MKDNDSHGLHKLSTTTLVIAALGVVFGDIGTSPIYTLKECFSPHSPHHIATTHEHILGVVSLVLWSLILLICVKYLVFILRADNKGEGWACLVPRCCLVMASSRPRSPF
jgi:KUP system potassium uptake protein